MYRHHKRKKNLPRGARMTLQHSCLLVGGACNRFKNRITGAAYTSPAPGGSSVRTSTRIRTSWGIPEIMEGIGSDRLTFLMPHVNTDPEKIPLKIAGKKTLSAVLLIRIRIGSGFNGVHGSGTKFAIRNRIRNPEPDSQSGTGFAIRNRIRNPEPDSQLESGSRRAKLTDKNRKKNLFFKCWMFSSEG
jgi:hypothetical protein